jgi:hypothetical protein
MFGAAVSHDTLVSCRMALLVLVSVVFAWCCRAWAAVEEPGVAGPFDLASHGRLMVFDNSWMERERGAAWPQVSLKRGRGAAPQLPAGPGGRAPDAPPEVGHKVHGVDQGRDGGAGIDRAVTLAVTMPERSDGTSAQFDLAHPGK